MLGCLKKMMANLSMKDEETNIFIKGTAGRRQIRSTNIKKYEKDCYNNDSVTYIRRAEMLSK